MPPRGWSVCLGAGGRRASPRKGFRGEGQLAGASGDSEDPACWKEQGKPPEQGRSLGKAAGHRDAAGSGQKAARRGRSDPWGSEARRLAKGLRGTVWGAENAGPGGHDGSAEGPSEQQGGLVGLQQGHNVVAVSTVWGRWEHVSRARATHERDEGVTWWERRSPEPGV